MSLQKFIDDENRMAAIFHRGDVKVIDINNITEAEAQDMFRRLDSNMSPESLFADGERPRAQAAKLAKVYTAAIAQLKAKGFVPKDTMYNV